MSLAPDSFLSLQTAPPFLQMPKIVPQQTPVVHRRFGRLPGGRRKWLGACLVLFTLCLVSYFNVDRSLTDEDRYYIRLFLPDVPAGIAPSLSYEQQIALIERAQRAVYEHTTGWEGIPEGQPREPKQLYLGRTGMCYDRSRTLEKIFTYLGFTNRHLALFKREAGMHFYETLLHRDVPSHAISEVKTKKGWLMADSNSLWISLDDNYQPVSMPQMQYRYRRGEVINWAQHLEESYFYNSRCIALYGVYSRHGRFYPPYISGIPDYRMRGLLYNFEQFDFLYY